MLRAVGFGDQDFIKPIVGLASGYSTITPCNMGINTLAERAEAGLRAAGAMSQLFGTITISDGISMGTEGMKYSLVSREVIADSIETACMGQSMDGVLAIGGCDKNMPGAMLAIARMNIPAIFVYGGTIKPGHLDGRDLTVVSAFEAVGEYSAGRIDGDEFDVFLHHGCRGCRKGRECGGVSSGLGGCDSPPAASPADYYPQSFGKCDRGDYGRWWFYQCGVAFTGDRPCRRCRT
jgi:dihydroxy-acid dehydratase